jgi:multidrug efflux pump
MTKYSLEHIQIVFLILLIIIIGGISAFYNLPREEDPGFVVRTAVVSTHYPGANPEKVELLVTSKLEKIIQEMPEIDYIQSSSKAGVSVIYVNILDEYQDPRPVWDELRRKVEKARFDLPENAEKPFVNDEFGDVFGSIITIVGDGFSFTEVKDLADYIREELLLIPNVAKVDIFGAQKEVVFLEYDIGRLAQFGLAPPQLKEILENTNILTSGGSVKIMDERLIIEPSGHFASISDIQKTVIQLNDKKDIVYLGDIVNVRKGYLDPSDSIVHSSGKRAIALAISMKDGVNILDLGEEIKKKLQKIESDLPLGIDLDRVAFQSDYVKKITDRFVSSLLQSIFIVISFILIFSGIRVGGVIASLVPVTVLAVFLEMFISHILIDKLSVAALIMSLGIIVDNSIVVSESILVRISHGVPKKAAILASVKELYSPLLVATLATSFSFFPVLFSVSIAGEYCAPMFGVIMMTLFSSWFLALTLIPVLCSLFFLEQKINSLSFQVVDSEFYYKYKQWLLFLIENPKKIFYKTFIMIILSVFIFNFFIPKIFFPNSNRASYQVEIESPQGTSIEKTEEIVSEIEKFLAKDLKVINNNEGIINWSVYIGQGFPRYVLSVLPEPHNPSYAAFIINTTSFHKLPEFITKTRNFCQDNFPDTNLTIKKVPTGPIFHSPVEIRIFGRETDQIFEYAQRVKNRLSLIDGVTEVSDDWGIKNRVIIVKINPSKAYRAGVTNKDIAISLQSAFSGFDISKYREEDNLIPIIYRTTEVYRDYLGKISTLNVYSKDGKTAVPLKQVADVSLKWQYPQIIHRDRIKTVTVKAQVSENNTAYAINRKIIPWLKKDSKTWLDGYDWQIGGSEEKFVAGTKSIRKNIPIALFGIIFLLMLYFNSFKTVIIILLSSSVPIFAGLLGLFFTGLDFSYITFLGIICLFGIVLNNVILLVDRINIEIKEDNSSLSGAVINASRARFRPVVLVMSTAIVALLPLWFMTDSMFSSLAVFMIFGFLMAIFSILFILPVFYSFVFRSVK